MYRTMVDFQKDWAYESEMTSKTFALLTDESLGQRVTPDGRSVADLAWHITTSLGEMSSHTGLALDAPAQDAPAPTSAQAIANAYKTAADSLRDQVAASWTDASLAEEVDMYGERWQKGYALAALVKHQIHHRAQMTVLMRQAGVSVPGVYGPAREEWAAMGLPPQK